MPPEAGPAIRSSSATSSAWSRCFEALPGPTPSFVDGGDERRPTERGAGIVEFALVLPVFLLLLLIMLEFGLAYSQRLTLTHATREGARTGSALAKGGATNCVLADPAGVDQQIIAALQRIVKSPGSDVVLDDIDEVRIYKSDAAGGQVGGLVNIWDYAAGAGPDIDPGVGVDRLDFVERSRAWPACSRNNGASPDSVGVRIDYTYRLTTPLAGLVRVMGGSQAGTLSMDDQTIMALNPTS